ncbi:hypothetical protein F4678DRAFT_482899 [Xylaria arbuscula]|nr:hypothetical protein F4678DRAFT_482899 [Xylaria arbuscula]
MYLNLSPIVSDLFLPSNHPEYYHYSTTYIRVSTLFNTVHVPQETHQIRGARETTEPPENRGDGDNPDTLPYIELRFSDGPRTSSGFVLGKDPETGDIFDDGCHRLIVRDLGSTSGTIATYDDKGRELRSNFDWIIDGFRAPYGTDEFIIEPHEHLKVRVIVNRHDITPPTYIDNVERFRQGAAGAEDFFGVLNIQTAFETERIVECTPMSSIQACHDFRRQRT